MFNYDDNSDIYTEKLNKEDKEKMIIDYITNIKDEEIKKYLLDDWEDWKDFEYNFMEYYTYCFDYKEGDYTYNKPWDIKYIKPWDYHDDVRNYENCDYLVKIVNL
jgi:hypothetical protein